MYVSITGVENNAKTSDVSFSFPERLTYPRMRHKYTYDLGAILTGLTDGLHKAFGFHTDYEFISK